MSSSWLHENGGLFFGRRMIVNRPCISSRAAHRHTAMPVRPTPTQKPSAAAINSVPLFICVPDLRPFVPRAARPRELILQHQAGAEPLLGAAAAAVFIPVSADHQVGARLPQPVQVARAPAKALRASIDDAFPQRPEGAQKSFDLPFHSKFAFSGLVRVMRVDH